MQKNINKYFRRAALNFKKKKEIERDKGWKTIRKRKKNCTQRSKRNPKDGWPKGGVSR